MTSCETQRGSYLMELQSIWAEPKRIKNFMTRITLPLLVKQCNCNEQKEIIEFSQQFVLFFAQMRIHKMFWACKSRGFDEEWEKKRDQILVKAFTARLNGGEDFLRFVRRWEINPAITPFPLVHHIPALSFSQSFSSSISPCHLSFSPSSPGLQLSQYAVTLFLSPACGGEGSWMDVWVGVWS